MRAPVKLGLHLSTFEFPGTAPDALFERLVEIAETAEASGFDTITAMDHLHQIPIIGPQEEWMLEGPSFLNALAARTSRVNLGLVVGSVTYRNPALLAKIATTLDVVSGGRAILGLGTGFFEDEHRAYGYTFPSQKERFERLEDAVQIARAMFTQEEATFEGRHHQVYKALNNPRPLRGDIPIIIGGSGERKTLRFVAKYADACNVAGDPDKVRHLMGVLDAHCEDVGRDPKEITRTRVAQVIVAPTHEEAVAKVPERAVPLAPIVGDPDGIAEQAAAFADAGLEGLIFSIPEVYDLENVEMAGRALAPVFGTEKASPA